LPKTLEHYDAWNLTPSSISDRSALYNLKPMGIGTNSVECLTSYIKRLANAHFLSPGVLLQRMVAPHITKSYWSRGGARAGTNGSALGNSCTEHAKAINGTGIIAADWVAALQKLTLRKDLENLTMLPWSTIFSDRNLLRATSSWCAVCYADQRQNDEPHHEPLLWSFRCITVCTKHHCRLRSVCPSCNKPQRWLARLSVSGHCPNCKRWLGEADIPKVRSDANCDISPSEWHWQNFVTDQLGSLISDGCHRQRFQKNRLKTALSACIDQTTDGNTSRFSKIIGKKRNTVWGWQINNLKIPLPDLLNICWCGGIDLLDFLYAKDLILNEAAFKPAINNSSGGNTKRRPALNIDSRATENALRRMLDSQPPQPMTAIALQLNVHKRTLYKHFPQLCKRISKDYRDYEFGNKRQRLIMRARHAQEARSKLERLSLYPSRRRIAAEIRRIACPSKIHM
jgi:TniQ protein